MESTAKKNYTLPIIMMVALFFMISFVTGLQNPFGRVICPKSVRKENILPSIFMQ